MIQTKTIDITHVKKILENCPNYNQIIKYEYPYGDSFSKQLIDWYRDLIFTANGNNENQMITIRAIDKCLGIYIKDNKYKRGLRKVLTLSDLTFQNKDLIKETILKMVEYTKEYETKQITEISVSKWL